MSEEPEPQASRDAELEHVIEKISTEHGFDVRGYKRTTLYRRIRKRMTDAGCASAGDYLVRLETDRHEYGQLISTILINVTEFYRDVEAWEYLQRECLGPMLRRKPVGAPIRAWSAGCASGEEPYTLALSIAQVLGDHSLRDVKIYATDVDEHALAMARTGIYGPEAVKNIPEELLARYFDELQGGRFAVRRELRSAVIFGRHNVLVDPPISRLDVLVCRNLLIYFDAETQGKLLPRFHYALREDGCMFLGKAETLMSRSMLFRPVEPRFRIFQRVPQQSHAEVVAMSLDSRRSSRENDVDPALQNYTLHAIVGQASDPALLLDPSGRILMASGTAREMFRIADAQLGRNFLELEEPLRPVPLRLALEEVRSTGHAVRITDLTLPGIDGSSQYLVMEVRPLLDPRGTLMYLLLWGRDLNPERALENQLTHLRQELETTSEELQTANEELETTNEELQSTNEELETTNEELQSTNEELETTVEELQSANEELETANEELRAREDLLSSATHHQGVVLSSIQMGLVVLDQHLQVTSWNRTCEQEWGLRENEAVGREVLRLDIGLDFSKLRSPLLRVAAGELPTYSTELDAVNRRGKAVRCSIRINPLIDGARPIGSVVMIGSKEN